MDIETVKRLLQIKTDEHDEYLEEAVPFYVEFAKDKCNDSFTKDDKEVCHTVCNYSLRKQLNLT
ncbi:phage head-tail connector protein [Bacillus licheniformis]|nr:phage head-tail connector protein [Bacillus licheniformis]